MTKTPAGEAILGMSPLRSVDERPLVTRVISASVPADELGGTAWGAGRGAWPVGRRGPFYVMGIAGAVGRAEGAWVGASVVFGGDPLDYNGGEED